MRRAAGIRRAAPLHETRPSRAPRRPPARQGTIAQDAVANLGDWAAVSLSGLKAWQLFHPCVAIVAAGDTQHAGPRLKGTNERNELIVLLLILGLGRRVSQEIALLFGVVR